MKLRVAAVLEALAEHVQAGYRGDAPPLDDLAGGVEHRHPQPRIGTAEAGGPDHGRDAATS